MFLDSELCIHPREKSSFLHILLFTPMDNLFGTRQKYRAGQNGPGSEFERTRSFKIIDSCVNIYILRNKFKVRQSIQNSFKDFASPQH